MPLRVVGRTKVAVTIFIDHAPCNLEKQGRRACQRGSQISHHSIPLVSGAQGMHFEVPQRAQQRSQLPAQVQEKKKMGEL